MRLLSLLLIILLGVSAAAEEMMTSTDVILVTNSSLSSDTKDKLSASMSRTNSFNGGIPLPQGIIVDQLKKKSFTYRATMSRVLDTQINVREEHHITQKFEVALVKVLEGPHRGKRGWVVVRKDRGGKRLRPAPDDVQAYREKLENAAIKADEREEARANSTDLSTRIFYVNTGSTAPVGAGYKQSNTFAGKVVVEVSVSNIGGVPTKSYFHAVVKFDGRQIKKVLVKPLEGGGSHRFNVELSKIAYDRGGTLTVEVDPDNRIPEFSEKNNIAKRKFRKRRDTHLETFKR